MAKNNPLASSVPVPRGLLELAGEFKAAISSARRELDSINRKLREEKDVQGPGNAAVPPELRSRKAELIDQIKTNQSKQDQIEDQLEMSRESKRLADNMRDTFREGARIEIDKRTALWKTSDKLMRASRRGISAAERIMQGGYTPADAVHALGGLLERKAEIAMEAGQLTSAQTYAGLSAVISSAATAGGLVAYGLQAFSEDRKAASDARLRSSEIDAELNQNIFLGDRFGSKMTGAYMREMLDRINLAGKGGEHVYTGFYDMITGLLGGGSDKQRLIGELRGSQKRIELYAAQHGAHWRARLDPFTLSEQESIRNQVNRTLDATWTGSAKHIWYYAARLIGGAQADPREAMYLREGIRMSGKRIDGNEYAQATDYKLKSEKPQFITAAFQRNIILQAATAYQHERYLQWNPY